MKLLKHTIGEGLAFIEGEAWKERRKILSKAFSFDFIKQQIPLISKIFD
jgi:cytochrome P450